MAAHDDLLLIINQLLQGLDKIGDSLSVVKAIGEDVKAMKEEIVIIKRRVVKMEERIGDELPTNSDVSAVMEILDKKLKPMEQIGTMDERLITIEGSISHLRSIDSETIADISDRVENTESKLVSMEKTMAKLMLSMENATQNRSIESHTIANICDGVENTESKLVSMEETMTKQMLTMENSTQHSKIKERSNYAFDAIFKGKKIHISAAQLTASRLRPHEDNGYYGGVLSNIPLRDDVAFEVRIDDTLDKWRGLGIGLGVIVKKDNAVKEKGTICYSVPGTYCIASWQSSDKEKSHIIRDGKVIRSNAYNLDTRHLPVGTTVGVLRRSNNALHFLLNGADKGVAFDNIPDRVFAFVDVSFYVSKVSIIS